MVEFLPSQILATHLLSEVSSLLLQSQVSVELRKEFENLGSKLVKSHSDLTHKEVVGLQFLLLDIAEREVVFKGELPEGVIELRDKAEQKLQEVDPNILKELAPITLELKRQATRHLQASALHGAIGDIIQNDPSKSFSEVYDRVSQFIDNSEASKKQAEIYYVQFQCDPLVTELLQNASNAHLSNNSSQEVKKKNEATRCELLEKLEAYSVAHPTVLNFEAIHNRESVIREATPIIAQMESEALVAGMDRYSTFLEGESSTSKNLQSYRASKEKQITALQKLEQMHPDEIKVESVKERISQLEKFGWVEVWVRDNSKLNVNEAWKSYQDLESSPELSEKEFKFVYNRVHKSLLVHELLELASEHGANSQEKIDKFEALESLAKRARRAFGNNNSRIFFGRMRGRLNRYESLVNRFRKEISDDQKVYENKRRAIYVRYLALSENPEMAQIPRELKQQISDVENCARAMKWVEKHHDEKRTLKEIETKLKRFDLSIQMKDHCLTAVHVFRVQDACERLVDLHWKQRITEEFEDDKEYKDVSAELREQWALIRKAKESAPDDIDTDKIYRHMMEVRHQASLKIKEHRGEQGEAWWKAALKAPVRALEGAADLTFGNVAYYGGGTVGFFTGHGWEWSKAGGVVINSNRRFMNKIGVGSVLGDDRTFASMSLIDAGSAINPLRQGAVVISPVLNAAGFVIGSVFDGIEGAYDHAATASYNISGSIFGVGGSASVEEYRRKREKEKLLKAGQYSFYIAEGAASLALTGGSANALRMTQALGVSAGLGTGVATLQEGYASYASGGEWSWGRWAENSVKGTSHNLLFHGGLSLIGKGYAVARYGGALPKTTAGLTANQTARYMAATNGAARLTRGIDVVDALSDANTTLEMASNAENWQQLLMCAGLGTLNYFDMRDGSYTTETLNRKSKTTTHVDNTKKLREVSRTTNSVKKEIGPIRKALGSVKKKYLDNAQVIVLSLSLQFSGGMLQSAELNGLPQSGPPPIVTMESGTIARETFKVNSSSSHEMREIESESSAEVLEIESSDRYEQNQKYSRKQSQTTCEQRQRQVDQEEARSMICMQLAEELRRLIRESRNLDMKTQLNLKLRYCSPIDTTESDFFLADRKISLFKGDSSWYLNRLVNQPLHDVLYAKLMVTEFTDYFGPYEIFEWRIIT